MSNNYSSWNIQPPNNISDIDLDERINLCLTYGTLAPSTHNSQPWRINKKNNEVIISLDQNRLLPIADPTNRDAFISLGCFVENCFIASKCLSLSLNIFDEFFQLLDNSRIKLTFSKGDFSFNDLDVLLFNAIPARQNLRTFYDKEKEIPNEIKEKLVQINQWAKIELNILDSRWQIEQIAKITGEAVRKAQSKQEFRSEFANYVKNNLTSSTTGMPGFSLGMSSSFISFFLAFIFRKFDVSRFLQLLNERAILASSAVIIITSDENNFLGWYRIGRLFERCNLFLISSGIKISIHIAAAELDSYAKKIQNQFNLNYRPQIIFRIGYSKKRIKHTPRRPLQDIFMNDDG